MLSVNIPGGPAMKAVSIISAATLALVLQGAFATAHAVSLRGRCAGMTATDFFSSDIVDTTSSTAFVNVTDGHLRFTTSGSGCVIIRFSGPAGVFPPAGMNEFLRVQTVLDGNSV